MTTLAEEVMIEIRKRMSEIHGEQDFLDGVSYTLSELEKILPEILDKRIEKFLSEHEKINSKNIHSLHKNTAKIK